MLLLIYKARAHFIHAIFIGKQSFAVGKGENMIYTVKMDGELFSATIEELIEETVSDDGTILTSPGDGSISDVRIGAGIRVAAGHVFAVLINSESRWLIETPCSGLVEQVLITEGASVKTGDALMIIR
jgi:acetyl/propionyl-CoA carboxylase alpha subunit